MLYHIGRCLAAGGTQVQLVPARGSADAVKQGVEAQGGELRELDAGVIPASDITLLYLDTQLHNRLRTAIPNIDTRKDVIFIRDLPAFHDAMIVALIQREIIPPE